MTQIKTSPPSVKMLQPLSIQHETRVRLPLPKSICVAVTVKPVRTTAKNMRETARTTGSLIRKELTPKQTRQRTAFLTPEKQLTGKAPTIFGHTSRGHTAREATTSWQIARTLLLATGNSE